MKNLGSHRASGHSSHLTSIEILETRIAPATVLNFTGLGGAITLDLSASTITESGFAAVSFSNVDQLNIDANGALTVRGTAGNDTFDVTPIGFAGGFDGRFTHSLTAGVVFTYDDATTVTFAGGTGGDDVVNLLGDEAADAVTATALTVTADGSTVAIGAGIEELDVRGLGGNDTIDLTLFSATARVEIYAGDGNDTIRGSTLSDIIYGGAGNDILMGGIGDDFVYGEDGNDTFGNPALTADGVANDPGADNNFGGDGFDNFFWEPGDGADFNQGGDEGADIFRFFGDANANFFTLRSGGTPTHFNALIGAVVIDNHGIEDVVVDGLGGADTFTVNDLFATEVVNVNLALGAADAAADSVTINGRNVADNLILTTGGAGLVSIQGLRYNVNLTAAEIGDLLTVNGNDGNDAIFVGAGVEGVMRLTLNGNAGSDTLDVHNTLFNAAAVVALNGGDDNDTLIGGRGNETMDGGGGDDTFLGNGGTDAAGGGGSGLIGDTILVPGTPGNDLITTTLNAGGQLLVTINGVTTTYTNFVGGSISTSGVEKILVQGGLGFDSLTSDSTGGAISIPITYDGGQDFDSLTLTGGTAASDIYSPGPNPGQGLSTIVIDGVTQLVSFENVEPVIDLVGGPLVVNANNANNAITYSQGSTAARGLVSVDGFETIEFSNKTNLFLNGRAGSDTIDIDNAATPTGLTGISIDGGAGNDLVALFGTPLADTFIFTGTDTTTGTLTLIGLAPVLYVGTERAQFFGRAGDDLFRVGSAAGRVEINGDEGSDSANFADALSGVVFNLDAVGLDQRVTANTTVTVLDQIENFTGSALDDILYLKATTFARVINGGPQSTVLPGDKFVFDGLDSLVQIQLGDANTGTIKTTGFADVAFDEFETTPVINSSGGGGFGATGASDAFSAGVIYNLTQDLPLPAKPLIGRGPTAVAVGDVNGDGFPDMVTANSKSKFLSVLLGLGDGTFDLPTNILSGGTKPTDLALTDLDGDLDLDIVVTNAGSKTVGVLLNDAGVFGAPLLTPKLKQTPGALAVGDVNADSLPDVVVTHASQGAVSVFLTGAGGVLGAQALVKTRGKGTTDVVVGDFSGDGLLDIATANLSSGNVALLLNAGAGVFNVEPLLFKTGASPTALAIADFNNDGKPDLAVSHAVSRFVGVLVGIGAPVATFKPVLQVNTPGVHAPKALAAGDFNGDGKADLALGPTAAGRLRVILGVGNGDFSQPYEFDLGNQAPRVVSSLVVADVNLDGLLDILTANTSSHDISVLLRKV